MSLKKKFVYFILIPVFILSGVSWFIINSQITSYNKKNEFEKISSSSDNFSLYIYNKLKADIGILKTLESAISQNKANFSTNKKQTEKLLKDILIQNHEYTSVWFIISDINTSEDPKLFKISKDKQKISSKIRSLGSKDLLYKTLLNKAEIGEKEVFINMNHQKNNIITLSIPLKINFITAGVCSIDINLEEALNDYGKKNTEKNQLNFILTENNDFIGSPKIDFIKDDFIDAFERNRINFNSQKKLNFSFYSDKALYLSSVNQISFKSGDIKWISATVSQYNKRITFLSNLNTRIIQIISVLILLSLILFWVFFNKIMNRLNQTGIVISATAHGDLKKIAELETTTGDEISDINFSLNMLNSNLDKTANYIEQIYRGNITFNYKPVSANDKIGNLTVELAKNIKHSKEEEEKRKREDEIQNWITKGSALFAEIIRDYSDNLEELSYAIISKLVNYIESDQGGIFVINEDENNEKYIELLASYAYDRRKMLKKRIPYGVGLVGRSILERETIFMTKIPDKYLNITSGLGNEKPKTLLIVPLIFHEEVYGVVELASFKSLDEYKIKLIEQVSESIASAISMVKINTRTAELLRETKIKSEQSASQEEEIRQNIEEMQAVTDGLNHKLAEANNILSTLKNSLNIAEFDMLGRITDINDNYLKILQKDKNDIIGKVQGSFDAEAQNPESFKKFWDDLRNGKTKEYTQVIKINDKMLKISSIYHPVKDADDTIYKVIEIANIE
ncbi:MAG: hypothetical protein DRI94_01840 [Bacteroidetes bacterium]|nr:MAG: hypothetical protein DRI94_01840 [Bacteroidota bacterium]